MEKVIVMGQENNKKMKSLALFLGVLLIIFSISSKKVYEVLIGIIFIYFSIYKKQTVVTKEGIFYKYKGVFLKHEEILNFSTVSYITICKSKNNKYIFYFIKDDFAKKLITEKEEVEPIVKLIESRRENIPIEYQI